MRRAVHWGWAWLATLIALCALTALASAQTPPPVHHVGLTREVTRVLDSLADDARTNRVENAACIVAYQVTDSVLVLERLARAAYDSADSVTIRAHGPLCPDGVPIVHSHVAFDGWPHPSDVDLATARTRGTWNLILSVHERGYFLVVY